MVTFLQSSEVDLLCLRGQFIFLSALLGFFIYGYFYIQRREWVQIFFLLHFAENTLKRINHKPALAHTLQSNSNTSIFLHIWVKCAYFNPRPPTEKQTGRMQGTSKYLRGSPEALRAVEGSGRSEDSGK